MKKNKLFKGLFCFFILNALAYGFRLDGISFNQRIDGSEAGYREFYLVNEHKVKERYRINVLPGNKNDISDYIEVYPKVITIDPLSKGIVKVFAKAPNALEKSEYFFKLQFQPISIPTLAKAKEGKITGVSTVNISPVVEMKGYVGEIDFENALDIQNIKVEKANEGTGVIFKGDLFNTSYAGIEFGIEFYGPNNRYLESHYLGDIPAKTEKKELKIKLDKVKNPKDIRKIVLYRTPSNEVEVLKEIEIKD